MRTVLLQLATVAVVLATLSGCATSSWQETTGEVYVDEKLGFSFRPPPGWFQPPGKGPGNAVYFTRDGLALQDIHVGRVAHADAFPHIEKESTADMVAEEIAEDYIANLTAIEVYENMTVNANEPATLGGLDGFRLDLEVRAQSGLRYREIHYGAAGASGLYSLVYSAAALHYFERDEALFETARDSMQITE